MGLAILVIISATISFYAMNPKETEGILWEISNETTRSDIVAKVNSSLCEVNFFENRRGITDDYFPSLKSLDVSIKISKSTKISYDSKYKFYFNSSDNSYLIYFYDRKGSFSGKSAESLDSQLPTVQNVLLDCLNLSVKNPRRINLD